MSPGVAEVVARAGDGCRGRIHRALCRMEARQYAEVARKSAEFEPGVTPIPASGKVIGAPELEKLVDASLDGWLTAGRFDVEFRRGLGQFLGRRHVVTTNSGSSANLVAISASPRQRSATGARARRRGDHRGRGLPDDGEPDRPERARPRLRGRRPPHVQHRRSQLEAASVPRTRAIMIAHTLGNPFDLDAVTEFAADHDLWLVEDCCDALGRPTGAAARWAPSATWRRSASTPPTTSRWARAAPCSPTPRV